MKTNRRMFRMGRAALSARIAMIAASGLLAASCGQSDKSPLAPVDLTATRAADSVVTPARPRQGGPPAVLDYMCTNYGYLTNTGFVFPIDRIITSDLNFGACGSNYFTGYRHTGADIMCPLNTPVRATWSGYVKRVSTGGWGSGNYAVAIESSSSSPSGGRQTFVHIVGHIRSLTVREGQYVTRGTVVGYVGPWQYGTHVHFAVWPGAYNNMPKSGWGMYATSCSSNDYNGFTEPIRYINTYRPA